MPGGSSGAGRQLRVNPVMWDANVCHTYWSVYAGQGNVAQNFWEGETPPAPAPPPGLNFCPIPPWCPCEDRQRRQKIAPLELVEHAVDREHQHRLDDPENGEQHTDEGAGECAVQPGTPEFEKQRHQ
ncbi:hypothetical protein [Mycobacterium sp. URHB0021]